MPAIRPPTSMYRLANWDARTVRLLRARRSERGATAVEYALMAGLIAVVIVAGVTAFGTAVNDSSSSFRQESFDGP